MDLKDAQALAWQHQQIPPTTLKEALDRLRWVVHQSVEAYEDDRLVQAQMGLEDALAQVLVAMKTLGLDPDRGLSRTLSRLSRSDASNQTFCFFPDRVEIRVAGEYRGGWALYTQEDTQSAKQLAEELGCDVVVSNEQAHQLALFSATDQSLASLPTMGPSFSESRSRAHLTLVSPASPDLSEPPLDF